MTTLSVNWELAPEGTTHYMPENDQFWGSWIKKSEGQWYIWYNNQWNEHYGIYNYSEEFIEKQTKKENKND